MGSWNATCMISNLPILSGERIKLVFLKSNIKGGLSQSCYVYPSGIMASAFLPISGEYNDYGSIENIDKDWNYDLIEKTLQKRYKEILVDKKPLTEFNLEDIIHGLERGSWGGFKTKKNKTLFEKESEDFEIDDLCYAMIREDVWNAVCEQHKGEFWNDNKEETARNEYYITAKEWCRRKYNIALEGLKELLEINERDQDSKTDEEKLELMKLQYNIQYKIRLFDDIGENGKLVIGWTEYQAKFKEKNADRDSMFKMWSELTIIHSFLTDTRKGWMIQSGAGSQHQEWKTYKLLNKIVDAICDKKINEEEY